MKVTVAVVIEAAGLCGCCLQQFGGDGERVGAQVLGLLTGSRGEPLSWDGASAVDLAAMADAHHQDHQSTALPFVDHAVVTHP